VFGPAFEDQKKEREGKVEYAIRPNKSVIRLSGMCRTEIDGTRSSPAVTAATELNENKVAKGIDYQDVKPSGGASMWSILNPWALKAPESPLLPKTDGTTTESRDETVLLTKDDLDKSQESVKVAKPSWYTFGWGQQR
jgi:hypothetical protein